MTERPEPPSHALEPSRRAFIGAASASVLAWASGACGREGPRPFRFSGIPDADKEELSRRYQAVAEYLGKALQRPVEYVHVPDYTAAVTALASSKIDAAWLGGVTAVQAEDRTPAGVHFVAAREVDLRFKSYFVANRSWVDRGTLSARADRSPQPLEALAALGPTLAQGSFTFGAKSSTSGHIMPRWFLESEAVGLSPESSFRGPPGYQLKGGHSATLSAVASSATDFGVVNYAAWESADEATRQAAPVVYVTPEYVDYCFVAHGGLDKKTVEALRTALVDLDPEDPTHLEVLTAFSAQAFVAAEASRWDQIRSVVRAMDESHIG
ncbi:MAG: PhnD/SsuA/transferrin family substrate-binding protein [Myxococcota bacterium]